MDYQKSLSLVLLFQLAALTSDALAQQDTPSTAVDHPVVSRYAGSFIEQAAIEFFGLIEFAAAVSLDSAVQSLLLFGGQIHALRYLREGWPWYRIQTLLPIALKTQENAANQSILRLPVKAIRADVRAIVNSASYGRKK
ncbi:MAG: hypothetical protein IIC61_12315 [Proteobacteria bacterium]|nr:hypothetical protein [Pseudomonadota bacterium]